MKNLLYLYGYLDVKQRVALLEELAAAVSLLTRFGGDDVSKDIVWCAKNIARRCPCDIDALEIEITNQYNKSKGVY